MARKKTNKRTKKQPQRGFKGKRDDIKEKVKALDRRMQGK